MNRSPAILRLLAATSAVLFSAGSAFAANPSTAEAIDGVHAQADAQVAEDPVVAAARNDASARLVSQIVDEPLDAGMTIGAFLDATQSQSLLASAIDRAEQVGGPRVLSRQFVQVRLQLSGESVCDVLLRAAEASGAKSPIKPDRIKAVTKVLAFRTFTATGMADAADVLANPATTQPAESGIVGAARADAARALFTRIEARVAKDDAQLAEQLRDPRTRDRLLESLNRRAKLSSVEQGPDEVRVTAIVSIDDEPITTELNAISPKLVAAVRAEGATPTIGRAKIEQSKPAALPGVPAWVNEPITTSASSPDAGGKLRTARAAEKAARESLREKLRALPLGDKETLGTASQVDPHFADAIDAAAISARVVGTDYRADGSVEVRVSIDGQSVWQAVLMR